MANTHFSGPVISAAGFKAAAPTSGDGNLVISAANNAAGVDTTITNATQSAAHTYTIPDAGANAFFVLSTSSTGAQTDFSQFVGINEILAASAGTWAVTRVAEANYVYRHAAAAETAILGIDITPMLRAASNKGFKLTSIDVIYSVGTAALLAHTATLDKVAFANNVAVSVSAVTITGTLATATQANPYVTALTVSTPVFDNTSDSKYVLEVTAQADTTTAYDFYGIVLKFTRNDI